MFHLSPDKDLPFTISLVKTAALHLLHQLVKGIFFGGNTYQSYVSSFITLR